MRLEPKVLKLRRYKTKYVECNFNTEGDDSDVEVRIGTQNVPKNMGSNISAQKFSVIGKTTKTTPTNPIKSTPNA